MSKLPVYYVAATRYTRAARLTGQQTAIVFAAAGSPLPPPPMMRPDAIEMLRQRFCAMRAEMRMV